MTMLSKTFLGLTLAAAMFVLAPAAANAAMWTPAETTTVAWYDAADASTFTESSGAVSAWADKSGNGNDVTQASTTKQPTTGIRSLNGLNVLDFDENPADNLIGSSAITYDTVYIVTFSDSMSWGNRPTVLGGANSTAYTVQWNNNVVDDVPDGWLGSPYYVNGKTTANTDAAAVVAGATLIRRNQTRTDTISVGSDRQLNNRGWDGYIAEVIYLNEATTDDLLKVEGYMMWKWGLEDLLPSDHLYKAAAPPSEIPEPASLALLGLGGMMMLRRRRA
jgi:hypothetical protein